MGMTVTLRDAIMASLIDTGGPWDPAGTWLFIFTGIIDAGIDTDFGDLTLPTGDPGDGHAVTTWSTAYDRGNGDRVVNGTLAEFRPADDTEGCVALGWAVGDASTSFNLLDWGYFDNPVTLVDENSALTLLAKGVVGPNGPDHIEVEVINGG